MQLCCRKTEYGFTLTEMMVVIFIGGVLTAIAIPAFMNWAPKYRTNGAARQVFSEMMAARAKAISESKNYIITFDTGNNSYEIYRDDNGDATPDTEELVKTVNIPNNYPGIGYGHIDSTSPSGDAINSDVTFNGSPRRVTFKSSGLVNKVGAIYLKPTDETSRKDRQRCITVALTGRVRLYKHNGSGWE